MLAVIFIVSAPLTLTCFQQSSAIQANRIVRHILSQPRTEAYLRLGFMQNVERRTHGCLHFTKLFASGVLHPRIGCSHPVRCSRSCVGSTPHFPPISRISCVIVRRYVRSFFLLLLHVLSNLCERPASFMSSHSRNTNSLGMPIRTERQLWRSSLAAPSIFSLGLRWQTRVFQASIRIVVSTVGSR